MARCENLLGGDILNYHLNYHREIGGMLYSCTLKGEVRIEVFSSLFLFLRAPAVAAVGSLAIARGSARV
jgi:hypothetical protein